MKLLVDIKDGMSGIRICVAVVVCTGPRCVECSIYFTFIAGYCAAVEPLTMLITVTNRCPVITSKGCDVVKLKYNTVGSRVLRGYSGPVRHPFLRLHPLSILPET